MKELIKTLKELQQHHEQIRGSIKMGLASHYWNGKADGVKEALEIVKKYSDAVETNIIDQ